MTHIKKALRTVPVMALVVLVLGADSLMDRLGPTRWMITAATVMVFAGAVLVAKNKEEKQNETINKSGTR